MEGILKYELRLEMSLQPNNRFAIPETMRQVHKATFPKEDHVYMKMQDEIGVIYADEDFVDLFGARGKPAEVPGRLALVTLMQYAYGLTDQEAADAVQGRIDWKYALGLPLEDGRFHYSVLSIFRRRLLEGGAEERLFNAMLTVLKAKDLLKAERKQRRDSAHILGAIRKLNRLELVGETLRQVLNKLSVVVPVWVQVHVPANWLGRHREPINRYRIPPHQAQQEQLSLTIGQDGVHLMKMIAADPEHTWLQNMPAVITLWRVWVQQYGYDEDGEYQWRSNKETPPATRRIVSPYDVEARQGVKRETKWLGYKVRLTETYDWEAPKLTTHVETRIACQQDANATTKIHQALAEKELALAQHVVDTSYVSGPLLVASQERHQIDFLGPVPPDTSWQTQVEDTYDVTKFAIDWDQQQVTCPQGKQNIYWHNGFDRAGKPIIAVTFSRKDCESCPERS